MREIVIYRWIFGLALSLAGLYLWFFKVWDEGFISVAFLFVLIYPLALLMVLLVCCFAFGVFKFVAAAWDFLLALLGLREWD